MKKRLALLAVAVAALAGRAFAEDSSLTRYALHLGRTSQGSSELARQALQLLLLERYGRLLPESLPAARRRELEDTLFSETASPEVQQAAADTLPPADSLVFDGKRLSGGNFRYIDALISQEGRPLAMDRQIPMIMVPLSREGAESLAKARDTYRTSAETETARLKTDRLHVVPLSPQLAADGILLRPYAGRLDDWYYRLVQEGDVPKQIQFYATIEALPERTYHPLTGLGHHSTVPPVFFNMSDVFSNGAFNAVRSGNQPGRNPFMGYAGRVIPFMAQALGPFTPGSEFVVPKEVVSRVTRDRRRFAPPPVPPIFRDPGRFLGALEQPEWIRCANAPALTRAEIEAEAQLPTKTAEPATNEILANSDLSYWENPNSGDAAVPVLPAIPVDPTPSNQSARGRGGKNIPTAPKAAPEDSAPATPPPAPTWHVAIVTPTVEDSENYIQELVGSEIAISENASALCRTVNSLRWIREVLSLQDGAPAPAPNPAAEEPAPDATRELARLQVRLEQLQKERLSALAQRSALRRAMEEKIRAEQLPKLKALTAAPKSI